MPKILRIINRFNLGGPTYSVALLTKHLQPEFEIKLIGGQKDDFEASSEFILNDLDVKYEMISEMRRSISLKQDRAAYQEIKKIIGEFKPDIVHTHAAKAGAIGRLAARKMNVPVIVHTFHGHVFHSYFGKAKTNFYKTVERYLAKRSNAIIALSEKQKKELCEEHRICDPQKTHIVPLGFDIDKFQEEKASKRNQFRKQWKIAEDEIAIGLVGRVVPIKNHRLFLSSFAALKSQTQQKVKAIIIGDGDEKEAMIAFCNELDLTVCTQENIVSNYDVVFTSWITDIDVANAGLDIMALSSLNEGTPVSLIEAQASSLPIVSTDVGGVRDIVDRDRSAFLVESQDQEHFTNKLRALAEDPNLRKKMGETGQALAFERFHYHRFCDDMKKVYFKLLKDVDKKI